MRLSNILFGNFNFFLILILIVLFFQYILLRPILGHGILHDDFEFLLNSKLWGDNIFEKLSNWYDLGPRYPYQITYMYFLDWLFGFDLDKYKLFGMGLKILATLSVYPCIYFLFKSRLLAFFTTLIFAISAASTGSLAFYSTGIEYLAITFMLFFFIFYKQAISYSLQKTLEFKNTIVASILLILAILTGPTRIYPIFLALFLIEIFLVLRFSVARNKYHMIRFFIQVFIPFLVTILYFQPKFIISADPYSLGASSNYFKSILNGNWFLALHPFMSLGYMFLPSHYFKFLGELNLDNIVAFFWFIIKGPLWIFTIITMLLSFCLPLLKIRFIILTFFLSSAGWIFLFFISTHHFALSENIRSKYDGPLFISSQYALVVAVYIVALALVVAINWFTNKKRDILYVTPIIGIAFALIFLFGNWIAVRDSFFPHGPLHRYLGIPQLGVSLFIASLMTLSLTNNQRFNKLIIPIVIFANVLFFISQKTEIDNFYIGSKTAGIDISKQAAMQNQLLNLVPHDRLNNNLAFYVEDPRISGEQGEYVGAFNLSDLVGWFFVRKSYLTDNKIKGCILQVYKVNELEKIAVSLNGTNGFLLDERFGGDARCYDGSLGVSRVNSFYSTDDFYAISLKGPEIRNIKQNVLKELKFKTLTPIN